MNPKLNHSSSSNPTSLRSRFTRVFLRSLIRINKRTPPTSSSPRHSFRRYRRVKVAADKSMALAVGSTRAWSRALLWKIQYKAWRHRAPARRIHNHPLRNTNRRLKRKKSNDEAGFCHAKELRKLVPGGEAMDLCSLLDETAHYIKCLITQVKVMRDIDEFYSI